MKTTTWPELADALHNHALALFLGADLPSEITGLPSRADLARGLASRNNLKEGPLAQVAQQVSPAGNRYNYTAYIKQELNTAGKQPQPFHLRIVELVQRYQLKTIITTAYDDLLEWAFRQAGVGCTVVVDDANLAFVTGDQLALIKLYGDAQRPESLVVTNSDHFGLLHDPRRAQLLTRVKMVFFGQTLLFLGYNLIDPGFQFLYSQIAANQFAQTAYAVWPGLSPAEVEMWRGQRIEILDTDPFGILGGPTAPSTRTYGLEAESASSAESSYKDASQNLAEAQKQERLAELYGRGVACLQGKKWKQAIALFQQILEFDKDYEDASQKLAEANAHFTRLQRIRAAWANHKTIISGIAALVLIVIIASVGLVVIPIATPTANATATPTATVVHLTDASVRFTITLKSGTRLEFLAGDTVTLATGEGILIQMNVTVDQSSFPHSLTYRYFAPAGHIPKGLTDPNASYIAPEQPGSDFVTVSIMDQQTGEEITRSVAVLIEK